LSATAYVITFSPHDFVLTTKQCSLSW